MSERDDALRREGMLIAADIARKWTLPVVGSLAHMCAQQIEKAIRARAGGEERQG